MADGSSSTSLRIALVSTCALSTPPKKYGGTELVVAELAEHLAVLGHRPTVFATGDSTCTGATRCLFDVPVWPPDGLAELRHASTAWERIEEGDFDVAHVNHAEALPFARFLGMPTVATVHHEWRADLAAHYAHYREIAFVAISARQAELSPEVPFRAVIHHGIDPRKYPLGEGGGYAAFLGRFAPTKGAHVAIDVARAAGVPLRLGGEAHWVDRDYFEGVLRPRIALQPSPPVDWLGEVALPDKVALLGGARCLLFPIDWEEPFGLVMIEAMLVGTPVVAFARGAAPEVIDEGVTGFVVRTPDEMRTRLEDVARLDRRRCRGRALERFGAQRMAREYAALYQTLAPARGLAGGARAAWTGRGANGRPNA